MTRMLAFVYAAAAVPTLLAPLSSASGSLRGDSGQDAESTGRWSATDLLKNSHVYREIPAGLEPSVKAVAGQDYFYEGCYNYGGSESSWYSASSSSQMTVELCYADCSSTGAQYMGLIFGEYCLCGWEASLTSYTAGGQGTCTMNCLGDSSNTCGGMWVFDLYLLAQPPSPTPSPAGSSPSPGGTLVSTPAQMTSLLDLHNAARCMHNADPLVYSSTIEATAQAYAQYLANAQNCGQLFHSQGSGYGENLYLCGTTSPSGCFTPEGAMQSLYESEVPGPTAAVTQYGGHATQILWKSTTTLGCGVASCTASPWTYNVLVCNYDPPGNYAGQYEQQLEQPSKTEAECGYTA